MAADVFGHELRRRRLALGLSLTALAKLIHYDKGYVSKVERGLRQPSSEFIRDCDRALRADGALAALRPYAPAASTGDDTKEQLAQSRDRRLSMLRDPDQVGPYEEMFVRVRSLGQVVSADATLDVAIGLYSTLTRLLSAGGPARARLALLAAHCAEFIGWMYQELGHPIAAHRYTHIARTLTDNPDLIAYTWVRHAEINVATGRSTAALRLAERVLADRNTPPRVRGFAAHRLAQAYATRRMARASLAALDVARRHFENGDRQRAGALTLGTTHLPDICAATDGWCEYELGQHEAAVDKLTAAVEGIPPGARRARAIHAARLSLAWAGTGDTAMACRAAEIALGDARYIGSATALADLRTLARHLVRRPESRAEALDLYLDISSAR